MKKINMIQEPTEQQFAPIDIIEVFPDIQQKRRINKNLYVVIILLSVALIVVSCILAYHIHQNNHLEDLTLEHSSEIVELTDNVSKLKKENDLLQDKLEQKNREIMEKSEEAAHLRIASEAVDNYGSTSRNSSAGSTHNIIAAPNDTETVCLSPGCNSQPTLNSYYCHRHKCLNPSCPNPKVNTLCNYCADHKCAYPDCNSSRKNGSYYCFQHSN